MSETLSRRSFLKGAAALALTPVLAKVPGPKPLPPPPPAPPLPPTVQTLPARYVAGWWWEPRPPYGKSPVRLRLYDGDTVFEEYHVPPDASFERLLPWGLRHRVTRMEATGSGTFGSYWSE